MISSRSDWLSFHQERSLFALKNWRGNDQVRLQTAVPIFISVQRNVTCVQVCSSHVYSTPNTVREYFLECDIQ